MAKLKITSELKGHKVLVSKINNLPKKMLNALKQTLEIGAINIRNNIIRSMQETSRAPWFYKRGNKRHYPSAPYNPPAIDGGGLVRSILVDARDDEIEVGAQMEYAPYLEDGTEKMKERPFLEPAYEEEIPKIKKNILDSIKRSTKQ